MQAEPSLDRRPVVASRRPTSPRRRRHRAWLACLPLALAACESPGEPPRERFGERGSRVDVYLRATSERARSVRLDLDHLALESEAGDRIPLDLSRTSLRTEEAARGLLLAGKGVEADHYAALLVGLRAATRLDGAESEALELAPPEGSDLEAPPPGALLELRVPLALHVRERDSAAIFLQLDVDASLEDAGRFRPLFVTRQETRQVLLGRLFVADRDSSSVLLVDREHGEVLSSSRVGPAPVALALSRDRRQLFAANSGDGSLTVLDARQGAPLSNIPVRLRAETADLVLADGGRLLVALNRGLDSLTFVDAIGLGRLDEVAVGRQPVRLAHSEEHGRLYVANHLDNSLSVVDVRTRRPVATLGLESGPSAVGLDRRQELVWCAHTFSPDLVAFDARTLAPAATVHVGGDVRDLLADRRRDRLYVARALPPELAIVDTRMAAVVRRIPLAGALDRLTQPPDGPSIWGVSAEAGLLVEIDVVRGRVVSSVPCGRAPSAVLAID